MPFAEKQLGQLRPANTTAVSLYSPTSGTTIVKTIFVSNTSGAAAAARIFFHNSGSTYNETTSLYWDLNIPADSTLQLDTFIAMDDATGNLGVRTDTANALTFTAFGAEIT